ncbi:hypothetical protein SAMN03159463_04431 [Mesorhizobium sp. NFR06]|uniref:VOC family protein n=1 Tax=Mesorhizobium sp. NFR06 TaxID=1566290 RepID=UPI0008EFA297|nr:VOC family protein [Mesorhizobium sp. NFR06]SFP55333.1 hypothetical protein SAMN03159463_04431 [Mesorhizobium sp. NFR06]
MISFVTLFARDVELTAEVYRRLGFDFTQEQHGSGRSHLAATNVGIVLEIYPGDDAVSPGVMIGVDIADLDEVRDKLLRAEIPVLRDIDPASGPRSMIASDPEGRKIFIRSRARYDSSIIYLMRLFYMGCEDGWMCHAAPCLNRTELLRISALPGYS